MKVKAIYEDQHTILDIPASKVLVLCEERAEVTNNGVVSDIVRVVEDHGDVVEVTCDDEMEMVLFFNPVWMADFEPSRNHGKSRVSCGYAVYVAAPGCTRITNDCKLEQKYLRVDSGFTILTTPRAIIHVLDMTEEVKSNPKSGNYRYSIALGNFAWCSSRRLSDELLEQLFDYLKVAREEGKDYSEHGLDAADLVYQLSARNDSDWKYSPNCTSKGYWDNVNLFWMFMK